LRYGNILMVIRQRDLQGFSVIRNFGERRSYVVCATVDERNKYGLTKDCESCRYRFICATGGIDDLDSEIENENFEEE